jgi:hypothetical protein
MAENKGALYPLGDAFRRFQPKPPGVFAASLIFYTTVSEVIDYQRVAVLETA